MIHDLTTLTPQPTNPIEEEHIATGPLDSHINQKGWCVEMCVEVKDPKTDYDG
jgi:hypothetical protein